MSKASKIISRGSKANQISPELIAQVIAAMQSQTAASTEAAPAKRTKPAKPEATHLVISLGKQQNLYVNLTAGNAWIEGDTVKAIAALRKAFPKAESVYRARKGK